MSPVYRDGFGLLRREEEEREGGRGTERERWCRDSTHDRWARQTGHDGDKARVSVLAMGSRTAHRWDMCGASRKAYRTSECSWTLRLHLVMECVSSQLDGQTDRRASRLAIQIRCRRQGDSIETCHPARGSLSQCRRSLGHHAPRNGNSITIGLAGRVAAWFRPITAGFACLVSP